MALTTDAIHSRIKPTARPPPPPPPSESPLLIPQQVPSALTVKPRLLLGSEHRSSYTTFNHQVEMEFHLELAHILISHEKPSCVKFSQDGKYVAVGCSGGEAHIFEVESGILTRVLRNLFSHEEEPIGAVSFSPDRKYLATGSSDGDINVWEINTKHVRNTFQRHSHDILSLTFSPDGRLLVSTSGDNSVRVWDMHDGSSKSLSEGNPNFLEYPCHTSVVFSPDGKFIATSHRDGILRIWDLRAERLLRRVHAHKECVYDLAFTPDGNGLVSASADHTLRYWDISSLYTAHSKGKSQMNGSHKALNTVVEDQTLPEREFLGHRGYVHSLDISPDGRWVVSGSADNSVRIWDFCNGAMQCTLNLDDEVSGVDFSPTGGYLASGASNGTIRIWKYSYPKLGR